MKPVSFFIFPLIISLFLASCEKEERMFQNMVVDQTGVDFSNRIFENDKYNILEFEYLYNGGGTAIGDFNNDGLQDIFFTGNMVNNEMYLNSGDFSFKKISAIAGIEGEDRWCSGTAVVDINNDGWLDLYVCATAYVPGERRANRLYINQGINVDSVPRFMEMAGEYGVADTSYSTSAAFFDYDNDGDLDLYITVNQFDPELAPNAYWTEDDPRFAVNCDRLYENSYDSTAGHPVFQEVSKMAGIVKGGFSLGLNILDINRDGWKDIYVSNDYNSPDMLWVNNGDKTFTDRSGEFLKHTCYSAMGMNTGDMNNDGLTDIFVLDMQPDDNLRRKAMLQPYDYISYLYNERYNYTYQYVRNVLQLNRGTRPDNGKLIFSDVSLFAGIHATDWSWTPMIADFDHDQFRDLIITNGFPKDITDHDFNAYMTMRRNFLRNEESLHAIPSVKLKNFAFRNELDIPGGIPHFKRVTEEWGITEPSYSSSAAYADLDNDGDLDYVVNNIDDSAFVQRNMVLEQRREDSNWLKISFKGNRNNINGIGAIAEIYYQGRLQMWENSPFRGYHSSVQMGAHFGLGETDLLDSVRIEWPGGKTQVLHHISSNQTLVVDIKNASLVKKSPPADQSLIFKEVSEELGIDFLHPERDYIDYNAQSLLLHKLSQFGPGLAVSDVNNDGLDDFYIGGSHFNKGRFFIQSSDGTFSEKDLLPGPEGESKREEELGVLFFDADQDQDEDLYLVSGGYEYSISDSSYQDRLFLNENGRFTLSQGALPVFLSSGSCVKAADFDRDGDLDLFVGGRVKPFYYPLPVTSYLLINDGTGNFSIGNQAHAPCLNEIGLISDALWTDYDNDGWVDLLLAGEWMPLTMLRNSSGSFEQILHIGGETTIGWWNSLASGDFDLDGDMDYVAGNLGSNSMIKASMEFPVSLYVGDYDNDMNLDLIPTTYYMNENGDPEEYPLFGREDMEKQVKEFRNIFPRHNEYGMANIGEVMAKLPDVTELLLKGNYQLTSYIENRGNGKFALKPLPSEAQLAPVFAILTGDYNDDQLPDILLTGNDYGNEIINGRYDALNGLLLRGDGKGNFEPLAMQESGIIIPGDGKSLVKMLASDSTLLVVSAQNRGKLGMFKSTYQYRTVELKPDDISALVSLSDSVSYREEFYYGNSYLSHSGRRLWLPKQVKKVLIFNYRGQKREMRFNE